MEMKTNNIDWIDGVMALMASVDNLMYKRIRKSWLDTKIKIEDHI